MPKAMELAEAICADVQTAVCESKWCIRKGLQTDICIGSALEAETHDPKYKCSLLIRKMVRAGRLGRKTGCGFFDYRS